MIAVYLYGAVCYVINIISFIGCDFKAPWKEEIITGLGIFIPVIPMITVWL